MINGNIQKYKYMMKAGLFAEGKGGNNTTPLFQHIANADLALTFNRKDAVLKVIKDRTATYAHSGSPATFDYAINQFSEIITRMIFGKNEIGIFEEGLKQQIEESIKHTIATFHEKRRY